MKLRVKGDWSRGWVIVGAGESFWCTGESGDAVCCVTLTDGTLRFRRACAGLSYVLVKLLGKVGSKP